MLDARVEVDEVRLAAHQCWASGLTCAFFGPVDPFDLVTSIADRFLALRGRVDGDRFVVGHHDAGASAVMVSSDHGSAALFTIVPGGSLDRATFITWFEEPGPFDTWVPTVQVELVDRAATESEGLIGIVTSGQIGSPLVFSELER